MSDRIKRYEMEVDCMAYCLGGTAKPDEVTWDGEDEDWEGYWCKSEDVAKLQVEIKALRSKLATVEGCEACEDLRQVRASGCSVPSLEHPANPGADRLPADPQEEQ